MSVESHTLMDGKVHVYRRLRSRFWQCSVFLGGRNYRQSTRQENLAVAMAYAKDWFVDRYADERLRQRGEAPPAPQPMVSMPGATKRPGRPARPPRDPNARTFREVAAVFVSEFTVMTHGERNAHYVAQKGQILRNHLLPFIGDRLVTEVTSSVVQSYRMHRLEGPGEEAQPKPSRYRLKGRARLKAPRPWKRPSRQTLHNEIVCLRQVLKTAARHGWLDALPDLSTPYRASGKVAHRGWFSPEEYKTLFEATRERAKNPKKERWRHECEQLHDYVLFMVNTGLRPDEAKRLEYRDVSIVNDEATRERILEIQVRGKRGVGYCKSMPSAVHPFHRLRKRNNPKPTDPVFGEIQRELFNAILNETGLKRDRAGNARTAYSLRHTYVCLRLLEGADIYQVAKNCRTSVQMIEQHYAVHLADTLDAAAINVRKPSRSRTGRAASRAPADA